MQSWLQPLGTGLIGAAEGYLEAISPKKDLEREEIQQKRQLLPLEVEQTQLDIAKARRDAIQPRIQSLGQGAFAISYPDGRPPEIRQLGQAQKDPANVARLRYILSLLQSDDPHEQELGRAELARDRAPAEAVTTRAQTDAARLKQAYRMHTERLAQQEQLAHDRMAAAAKAGDLRARMQAQHDAEALKRQRERFQFELEKLEILESGRDYRSELSSDTKLQTSGGKSTGAGGTADMTVEEAEQRLKEYRNKRYFPGQSAQHLEEFENTINRLKAERRSHIGPVLTRRLQRLQEQLDRAERREGGGTRPQSPRPGRAPQPGPSSQAAPGSGTPAPGATPRTMVDWYEKYYRGMSQEEASVDLQTDLRNPQTATSVRTRAKREAFRTVFPGAKEPTGTAAPTAQPGPGQTPAAPPQARPSAPTPAPRQTPEGQSTPDLLQRYAKYYEPWDTQALEREASSLQRTDPGGLNLTSQYRQRAIQEVLRRRKAPGGPIDQGSGKPGQRSDVPPTPPPASAPPQSSSASAPPRSSQRQPQGLEEHARWLDKYHDLSTTDLQQESMRVLKSDPLARHTETSARLTALNQLLDERKAQKPYGDMVDETLLARYRDEYKRWDTAKLAEQSHTLRGTLVSTLLGLHQSIPLEKQAIDVAVEAAKAGGALVQAPTAGAGLGLIALPALGIALAGVATLFPDAGAYLKDLYHRQLAMALEMRERRNHQDMPAGEEPD